MTLWFLFQPNSDTRLALFGLDLHMATGGFVAGNRAFRNMLKCNSRNPAAIQTRLKTLF